MRSEWRQRLLSLSMASLLLASSGCGLLGKKNDLNRLLNYNPQGVGCMNDLGPHMKAYYQGTIDAATWADTWNCATSNLTLFKRFVNASDPNGFTREDIQLFISEFLITNANVSSQLIGALFELKASLFGGSKDVIAPAELDQVVALLEVLRDQTTRLLPNMVQRATEASPANLLALADALLDVGDHVAAALHTEGNPTFSFTSVQTLVRELGGIMHIDVSPELVTWLNVVKVVLTAGDTTGISAADWPVIVHSMVSYGGPALALFSVDSKYLTGPNATGRFYLQLGWKVKTSLLQTFGLYGGALPLATLDDVIDSLPADWLTIDRSAVKGVLRPVVNKLLQSRVPNAMDTSSLDLVFNKLQFWCDGQTALEAVFEQAGAGPIGLTFDDFNRAAMDYVSTLSQDQRPPVYRMVSLARQTVPLFLANDDQMTFTPNLNYSLHDLSLFNWITMLAEQVVHTYSSVPGGMVGKLADLQALVTDFTDIARALHATDLTVPNWAAARFVEASLFTFASRGDNNTIDIPEAMYLIAMAYSAGQMSKKLKDGVEAACPSEGQDVLGYQWLSIDCFRKELFGNFRGYWDHEPLLVQYYRNLSDKSQKALQQAMERAGRRYGVSTQPIASNDEFGFSGIVQYVESLLARWDTNADQYLNLDEANRAYPVFKGPLALKGGIQGDPDWIIHAVFTYVLKYGHPPAKNVGGILSLGWWIAQTPFWSLHADRLILYQVIASIVQPEALPPSPAEQQAQMALANDLGRDPAQMSYSELSEYYNVPLDQKSALLTAPTSIPIPVGF